MFIPGRKRRSDDMQCMCRKTLGGILKLDPHCSPFLNLSQRSHHAFHYSQEEQKTLDQLEIKIENHNFHSLVLFLFFSLSHKKLNQTLTGRGGGGRGGGAREILSFQNISGEAVAVKFY